MEGHKFLAGFNCSRRDVCDCRRASCIAGLLGGSHTPALIMEHTRSVNPRSYGPMMAIAVEYDAIGGEELIVGVRGCPAFRECACNASVIGPKHVCLSMGAGQCAWKV